MFRLFSVLVFITISVISYCQTLIADGENSKDFGEVIDVDGPFLAIGDPKRDLPYSNSGAVFVYERINDEWVAQDTIVDDDPNSDGYFGSVVRVSGNKMAILKDYWIKKEYKFFELKDGVWVKYATLDYSKYSFQSCVDFQDNQLIIGNYQDDTKGDESGVVHIYNYKDDTWTLTKSVYAPGADYYEYFGYSVSMSADNFVVGAYWERKAYVYDLAGNLLKVLTHNETNSFPSGPINHFGHSVSTSGRYIAVSAVRSVNGGTETGAVYVFDSQNSYSFEKILPSDLDGSYVFGETVAISDSSMAVHTAHYGSAKGIYLYNMTLEGDWVLDSIYVVNETDYNSAGVNYYAYAVAVTEDYFVFSDISAGDGGEVYSVSTKTPDSVEEETETGLVELYENELSVFPNPATDVVHVNCVYPIESIELLDVSGVLLITSPDTTIEVGGLEAGLYVLKVNLDSGEIVFRSLLIK